MNNRYLNWNFRLTLPVLLLMFSAPAVVYLANYYFPNSWARAHGPIEVLQLLILSFGAVLAMRHVLALPANSTSRQFWLWSILWWVLVFGRSINWGRLYFPEVPKWYFRVISIILIITPLIVFLYYKLWREISKKLTTEEMPAWYIIIALLALLLADTVEHRRFGYTLLLYDPQQRDAVEESLEVICFLSLILGTHFIQKNELNTMLKER